MIGFQLTGGGLGMLNKSKIDSFLILAQVLNFTQAADELYITQQALSSQIASIEADVGGKLFARTTKKVALTPLGEELYHFFQECIQTYNEILQRNSQQYAPCLKICCFEDMDIGRDMNQAKKDVMQAYPSAKLQYMFKNSFHTIMSELDSGHIDVAIIPEGIPFSADKYQTERLDRDNLYAYFLPILCKGVSSPTLADLKDAVFFVGHEKNVVQIWLNKYCAALSFRPVYYEGERITPSLERMLVENGEGVGFGGRFSTLNRDKNLAKMKLEFQANVVAVWKRGNQDAALSCFIQRLKCILRNPQ